MKAIRPERHKPYRCTFRPLIRKEAPGKEKRQTRKELLRKNYRLQAEFISRYILGQKIYNERKDIIDEI